MTGFKLPSFDDRRKASQAAKLEALAKLRKAKAETTAPAAPADPDAKSSREIAAEERRAAHRAKIEADKAARIAAREAAAEAKANQKAPLTPEEQKAARDARYAARKARKGK